MKEWIKVILINIIEVMMFILIPILVVFLIGLGALLFMSFVHYFNGYLPTIFLTISAVICFFTVLISIINIIGEEKK